MRREFPLHPSEFCITDVGSTTTKAILFKREGDWGFFREGAPTTVEKPHEDVTVGVTHALRALEQSSGATLLKNGAPAVPYLSTSSAGGGLAMVVTGLVREVTSRSAERVALGAGAILLDVVAMNDGRTPYEKIEVLKTLRPDMILLAGGFDGEAITGPVYLAEMILESGLRPKLSKTAKLPVLFAGNVNARDFVEETFGGEFMFHCVPNIRPNNDQENLDPAREAIHELFMNHVMSQAPGYEGLVSWVDAPIQPTPSAFGKILGLASRRLGARILAIDIGGATTDVFTAKDGEVHRTVSANLGMSYSILNVAEAGGIDSIGAFLDVEMTEEDLWDGVGNKHLRPTRLPRSAEELKMEWATAAVAIRDAVKDHLRVLEGFSLSRGKEDLAMIQRFIGSRGRKKQLAKGTLALSGYDLVIGSGGILSHSPRDAAALMLAHALQPQDPVDLAVDSAFMFPHLGVLSDVAPDLALDLFFQLGLVRLGPLLVAGGDGLSVSRAVRIKGATRAGRAIDESVRRGEVRSIPLAADEKASVSISGAGAGILGRGLDLQGGECGLIVDARDRPLRSPRALLIPGEPTPPRRGAELPEREPIHRGALRIRRELAVPGKVFVEQGEMVQPDTLIARSTQQFLRPFFLDVRFSLKVPPEDVPRYMLKKVGDEVAAGDLIARRGRRVLASREFRTNVGGRIERILPSGTVLIRENPEVSFDLRAVSVAKDLRKHAHQIKKHLRVEVGQKVERGQAIAALMRPGDIRISKSPVRGKVKEINEQYGIVMIEPLLEELQVRAWMPGRVEDVTDRGCTIANEGVEVIGSWGTGGEVYGELTSTDPGPGRVMLREFATRDDLIELEEKEATGLVTGGLHLRDARELELSYTIVMTGEFGEKGMGPSILGFLRDREDQLALLDGTTELRVGVRRPRVLLPEASAPTH